jgi:IclR family KDG regulon transcriptional repressor
VTGSFNQSLANGLQILLLYDTSNPRFTVVELSKRLGYSESKTYRLIRPLIKYGFLQGNPGTSQYSLGLNALRLGLMAQQKFEITLIARPIMRELSLLTKETVLLTAVNGTKGIVLDRVESMEPVRYSLFQPGVSIPLYAGASSKILMAYLPEADWAQIIAEEGLKQYTPNTITEATQLKDHLREIREKGYAFSDQEIDLGVRAIAAPVLNGKGELVAGLTCAGPAYRIKKKKISSCGKLIIEYAQKIWNGLGGS